MIPFVVVLAAFSAPFDPSNLLLNSDFEAVDLSGMPAPWALFVLPRKGVEGRIDSIARNGESSVMLHTPEPYPTEPANNWSQVILRDVASKELRLEGYIRTEAATEAALWLQCFSQNPARVVAAQTSSIETPVRGTSDWTRVEVALRAPQETDFLVVRCVLTGTGKAWFDSIALQVGSEAIDPLDAFEPIEEMAETEPDDNLAQDILALSQSIQDSVRELEAANAALLLQIADIERGLALNQRPVPLIPSAMTEPMLEPLTRGPVRHPLVPHGYLEGTEP